MNKLIINNRTDLPMIDVLPYITAVVRQGRISNDGKQLCYATTFRTEAGTIVVFSNLRAKSDSLTVCLETSA